MTLYQSLGLLFAVATAIVIVPIVLAVLLDRRGRGERVPRDPGRMTCWVVGLILVAFGFYSWVGVVDSDYLGAPGAGLVAAPLFALGILGVVRPRWAA